MKHIARLILSSVLVFTLFAIMHTIIAEGINLGNSTAKETIESFEITSQEVTDTVNITEELTDFISTEPVETALELSKEEQKYINYIETYPEEIEEDIWYLTCFLYGECRGSNQTLQSCCAWAILNYTGKGCPGNIHRVVKYYGDGTYWSNYITSFGRYRWSYTWTITEGKKAGKTCKLRGNRTIVADSNPVIWNRCKDYATDVYHRWLKELSGYSAEEVGRTLPTGYIHFWADKKNGYGTTFPKNWATRYDHSGDFVIDYENSPYNTK